MAEESPVLTELQANIGVVTLNRPGKFNCISRGLADGLSAAVRSLEANAECRVVVLKANGKHFCTGADLDEVLAARETRATLEAFITAGHDALTALERSRLPIVGAVHGLCLAGGLELMMACDVVFAASSARFGDQHAQYGLIPGWGGTQRLPRLVGLRRALHLMYSAEWLDATTARECGLVNIVVEETALAERAMTYAQTLAVRNPQSIAAMKSLARQGLDVPLAEGLARECECVVDALRSENVSEGLAAFQARRVPKFS
ncbi:MAG: enoyl-CoA hydratase/isomerase family protein [Geminicoccaceae bacterium]|jgi:enoyl-CoA hydratase/carnithine racemase|nr:MAG: enoyl-CoA hydratase/isomerase family protein [Enhydrobacter sp.]